MRSSRIGACPDSAIAHRNHRHTAPTWLPPIALGHRPDGTAYRTSADTGLPAKVRSLPLAVFPSPSGSTSPFRLPLDPNHELEFPATSGSVSGRSGPPLASARMPAAGRAVSNRNTLSSPRRTPLADPVPSALEFPPALAVPNALDGTRRSNLQSLLRRLAPVSTKSPSAPPGLAPWECPRVATCRCPSRCIRA